MAIHRSNTPLVASPRVHAVLRRLHDESLAQEHHFLHPLSILRNITIFIRTQLLGQSSSDVRDAGCRDKFVALEQDKCEFVYSLARAIGAQQIIEAGTSFGVSTIYLALAVSQNVRALQTPSSQGHVDRSADSISGKVIATEWEATKSERAKRHWKEAGDEVEPWIHLKEGDLLQTLNEEDCIGQVDMLLLDIWTPLALPTLQLVKSRLRHGAVVVADNTISSAKGYDALLKYLRDPLEGFRTMTMPYKGGLELSVYLPEGFD